jgi:hypothetical protein
MTYLDLIVLHDFVSEESKRATCRGNSSLFVLVDNPGVIWHPETGQCLHTKLERSSVSGGTSPDDPSETLAL